MSYAIQVQMIEIGGAWLTLAACDQIAYFHEAKFKAARKQRVAATHGKVKPHRVIDNRSGAVLWPDSQAKLKRG